MRAMSAVLGRHDVRARRPRPPRRGAMTGGKKIAGTGTIDDAGEAGLIGGIRQKIVGAKGRPGDVLPSLTADNCRDPWGKQIEGASRSSDRHLDDAARRR